MYSLKLISCPTLSLCQSSMFFWSKSLSSNNFLFRGLNLLISFENFSQKKFLSISNSINISLNGTLSRTLMTSLTTLLALAALFIFGGIVISSFIIALIWGVLIGTYSSLYVASPILTYLKSDYKKSEDGNLFIKSKKFNKVRRLWKR